MKTKIVYISGFEGYNDSSVSGFDWYPEKQDALSDYQQNRNDYEQANSSSVAYYGELRVGIALTKDQVTDKVEAYLRKHDYDNAPLKNKQMSKRI